MPGIRKYRRDTSEVSCCLKYVIFGVNVLFWFLGLVVLAVGIWAWSEKDTFNNLSRLTNIALDPAFILICVGTITFIIGFTGCVGALRENTCLLACYAVFLALLLLAEMTVGILFFVFKDWIKQQATSGFQTFITHYREDPDQQNLIDWIQEDWLQCCGVEGPRDWDRNAYFNCSSGAVGSREACGVPFSCCRAKPTDVIRNKQCGYDVRKPNYGRVRRAVCPSVAAEPNRQTSSGTNSVDMTCASPTIKPNYLSSYILVVNYCNGAVGSREACGVPFSCCRAKPTDVIRNKQCGYDVRKPNYTFDIAKIIYDKGCLEAAEEWFDHNLLIVATSAVCTAFAQILGICFAQNLRADIFAQKAKWH
ncbi:tetraspanin family domain-containing protein [Phthorimaea operculella]|nr:tetraspanin family domain-containing protein [Phthorimaea operculella]